MKEGLEKPSFSYLKKLEDFLFILIDNHNNKKLKMVKYYCPYCNPKYQFQKQSTNGTLICGLCGEDLVKKPFIMLNQIIALVAASSLLLPLIYTFIFLIKNQINPPNKNYQANIKYSLIIKKIHLHKTI